jgi:hypothetical protein
MTGNVTPRDGMQRRLESHHTGHVRTRPVPELKDRREKALRILSCPSLPSSMKNPTRQWASKSGDPWKSGSPFQRARHGFGGRALVGLELKPAGTAWNLHCPSTNPPLEPRDWPLKAPSSGLDAHQWAVPEAITRLDDCNFHAWPPRLISDVSIYITGARCLVRRYFVQSLISIVQPPRLFTRTSVDRPPAIFQPACSLHAGTSQQLKHGDDAATENLAKVYNLILPPRDSFSSERRT